MVPSTSRNERKKKNKARRQAQKNKSVQAYRRRAGLSRDEDEVPLASYFRRFFAYVVDQMLFLVFNIFCLIFIYKYYAQESTPLGNDPIPSIMYFVPQLFFGGIYLIPSIVMRGQTLGCRRVKIVIIREDGRGLLSWKQGFIRWFVVYGAATVIAMAFTPFSGNKTVLLATYAIYVLLPYAVMAPALWTSTRQGLHDRLAGAVVVRQAPILAG